MVVSPAKSLLPKLTQAQQSVAAAPGSVVLELGVGISPPASRFGDPSELGLVDLDGNGREDGESDGDDFVPLS